MRRFFHIVVFFLVLLGALAVSNRQSFAFSCNTPGISVTKTDNNVHIKITVDASDLDTDKSYTAIFKGKNSVDIGSGWTIPLNVDGNTYTGGGTFSVPNQLPEGDYFLVIGIDNGVCDNADIRACIHPNHSECEQSFGIDLDFIPEEDYDDRGDNFPESGENNAPTFNLCDQANASDKSLCQACLGGATDLTNPQNQKLWTAFGCINVGSPTNIVQDLLRIGLAMSGGFVLLTILYGSFMLSTSSGNPKRVEEAQQMISSAVMGLFFVIFSVVILQFIGVSILRIPGFGT